MNHFGLMTIAWVGAGLGVVAASAQAAEIQPTSAVATSFYSAGAGDFRSPDHTRNGSGLTSNATVTTFDDPHSNIPNTSMWLTANDTPTPQITWTLDQNYDLTGFHLWNYNEVTGAQIYTERGVQQATILVSTTLTGEAPADFVIATPSQTFTQATGQANYTGEDYTFNASNVRRVRFQVISDFPGNRDNYIGLSEIRFVGTATPEPASIGIIALASLPLLQRRRAR